MEPVVLRFTKFYQDCKDNVRCSLRADQIVYIEEMHLHAVGMDGQENDFVFVTLSLNNYTCLNVTESFPQVEQMWLDALKLMSDSVEFDNKDLSES